MPLSSHGRLLLVAPEPVAEDRGTPIALRHVLTVLSDLGAEVDLLTYPVGRTIALPGLRVFRSLSVFPIQSVPVGFSLRKVWLDWWLFLALWRRLRWERYAAVYAVEEAVFLAHLVTHGTGMPVIYDMQSSLAEQMAELALFRNRAGRAVLNACEGWAIRRAALIMCSLGLKPIVQAHAPDARVQEWVYPGQREPVTPQAVAALRAELDIAPGHPVILYIGNFAKYQGVQQLTQAIPQVLAAVPAAVFVLVGAHPKHRAALERSLTGVVPLGACRIVERQARERMPAFLELADIVVSPRAMGNNLPLKVLEYLAAGRSIVATKIPAHEAVLNDSLAVLAQPTPDGLGRALVQLLKDPASALRLQQATRQYAAAALTWGKFSTQVFNAFSPWLRKARSAPTLARVSVVIPARNAATRLGEVVRGVLAQRDALGVADLEVLVADDGSTDDTARVAAEAGARVIASGGASGNPGAARNRGAAAASGEILLFLDDDCTPAPGWLAAHVQAHQAGAVCVGGPLALPPHLPLSARWDYYSSGYHTHPRRPTGVVPNHPPANLSIRAELFRRFGGFTEQLPVAHGHEELALQAQVLGAGQTIHFEPEALAYHHNRSGWGNLFRRTYRWAASALQSKAEAPAARAAWRYRHPRLMIACSPLLVLPETAYILSCWLAAGYWDALFAAPVVLAARAVYAAGFAIGGARWLACTRAK